MRTSENSLLPTSSGRLTGPGRTFARYFPDGVPRSGALLELLPRPVLTLDSNGPDYVIPLLLVAAFTK